MPASAGEDRGRVAKVWPPAKRCKSTLSPRLGDELLLGDRVAAAC
jgi:hypothetical protein